MGKWITGDVHVHSHCCWDGSLAVDEIVERAKPYCDFLAISGHARHPDLFRVEKNAGTDGAGTILFEVGIVYAVGDVAVFDKFAVTHLFYPPWRL